MKSLFDSPDRSAEKTDKTDRKQSIKQKWKSATKSATKPEQQPGSPEAKPYSWLRNPSPDTSQYRDPIDQGDPYHRPSSVPPDHPTQRRHTSAQNYIRSEDETRRMLDETRSMSNMSRSMSPENQPLVMPKSGVIRSMSVTSLSGLDKEKDSPDPITSYFDMEKKEGHDTLKRKKGLFGLKTGSVFDLFSFDDGKEVSSDSSSSEETVKDVIKRAPKNREITNDQPVIRYSKSKSVQQGPVHPIPNQVHESRPGETDPFYSPKPNRRNDYRNRTRAPSAPGPSPPAGNRPTPDLIAQGQDRLKPISAGVKSKSSKVLNNPHPQAQLRPVEKDPVPPPRDTQFMPPPLRDELPRTASQRSLLIASAHLRQEPDERPFDRMDPSRESARSLLQRLAPQRAANLPPQKSANLPVERRSPESPVVVRMPERRSPDSPVVVRMQKTEKVSKRSRNDPTRKVHIHELT